MKKLNNISEIRCEEYHDHQDGTRMYIIYFHHSSGRVEIVRKSRIKPKLIRQVSKVY